MKNGNWIASYLFRRIALLLCILLLPHIAAAETPPKASPYTIAVIPFYSPEKIWLLYTPFIQYLKATTGQPWELKLYPDHDSLINELCADQVGIALLGPVPMARVNKQCGAKPFLAALSKEGKPSYHSVILTGDPAVTELTKVKGRTIGFFKGSTAAHIVPMKMLKDAGVGAGSFQAVFLESQDRIMTALLSKDISAAGVKETLYRKFKNESLRVLKQSDALPNFGFTASPRLPAAVRELFASTLLKLQPSSNARDAETTRSWDDEIKNGFVSPNDEYLTSVTRLNSVYQEVMHDIR